ncbi:MAG: FG-GAP repeat protein [Chitinophagales bacterium]|nr:FG-GAP repeat protein [Chitinophagales bacterium]
MLTQIPLPDATMEIDQSNAYYGFAISNAGDVNGDGYIDMIVGAKGFSNGQTSEGRVYVYHRLDTGINTISSVSIESNQAYAFFGNAVSSAGDVNGDGFDDIIVGASEYDNGQTNEGRVYIFFGSSSGINIIPAQIMESDQAYAFFGNAVSAAGDVNNDGYDDVIVGAYWYDQGQSNEGRVYIYHGSPIGINTTPVISMEGNQINAHLGVSVSGAGDVNSDGYDDVIVGADNFSNGQTGEGRAYIYYGSATGISPVSSTILESNQEHAGFGFSVSDAGDVNGDDYYDVIIGAHYYDNVDYSEGRAYIYHGSSTGINTIPGAIMESDQTNASFGEAVSGIGDVNNDSYDDVIVGAINYNNDQLGEGRAYLYHGSSIGINIIPTATIESDQLNANLGVSFASIDDVNNDSYDDIFIGADMYDNGQINEGRVFIYYGNNCSSSFYYADADNDGYGNPKDLIVTCLPVVGYITDNSDCNDFNALKNPTTIWYLDSDADHYYAGNTITQCASPGPEYFFSNILDSGDCNNTNAVIFPMAEELLDGWDNNCNGTIDENFIWTFSGILESNQAFSFFGGSVSGAGDVNGDGYADVIVGAEDFDNGQTTEGRAYIYHGTASGITATPAVTIEVNKSDARFGCSVSGAGDVNGDGYADVIVGAYNFTNDELDEGRAYIYHGSATGINTIPATILENEEAFSYFAYSVDCAGDVNNDGYDDVIIGAYQDGDLSEGKAYIYHGSESGINAVAITTLESNIANALFGRSVSGAGDVNKDNYDDVIVGAHKSNFEKGKAYIYHGSSLGINTDPAAIMEGDDPGANLGNSVSEAGDVNGDGYDDVIVGAENYDNGQASEGRAYIYQGSTTGINTISVSIMESNQEYAHLGRSVSDAGDLNGDGYDDVIVGAHRYTNDNDIEGKVFIYYGSVTGCDTLSATTLESNQASAYFGDAVSGAGDINGDGHDDAIVGAGFYDNSETNEGVAFVYLSCINAFYADADGDGFGNPSVVTEACTAPAGYVSDTTDCNDVDAATNPGATELCNGIDDNCNTLTDDGIIETISISATGPITFCQGGSVVLTSAFTGATTQWKKNGTNIPGATGINYTVTQKGIYTCETTSACDTALSESLFVNVKKNPNAGITAGGPTTFCAGGSVTLTETPVGGSTYQWYKGASAITGATTTSYIATITGNYKCRVTKTATGCSKNSNSIMVSVPCKEGEEVEPHLLVYPNPTGNDILISAKINSPTNSKEVLLNIYNPIGEVLFTKTIHVENASFQENISLRNYPAGIYIVELNIDNVILLEKIIKE